MSKITRLFKWYFTRNALPFWGILIMDCAIVFISCIIGFYPGHRAMQTLTHYPTLLPTAGILALLSIVGFRLFHTYSGIFRYSSFVDLMKVTPQDNRRVRDSNCHHVVYPHHREADL